MKTWAEVEKEISAMETPKLKTTCAQLKAYSVETAERIKELEVQLRELRTLEGDAHRECGLFVKELSKRGETP